MTSLEMLAVEVNRAINHCVDNHNVTLSDLFCVLGGRVEMMLEKLPLDVRRELWNEFTRNIEKKCFNGEMFQ